MQRLTKRLSRLVKHPLLVVNHVGQGQKLPVIPVAPAVNRLLAIAHHQRPVPNRKHVLIERHQVLPLRHRGVLEFVDEDVVKAAAHSLKQEGHRVFLHHTGHAVVQRVEGSHVLRRLHMLDLF